ncbi:unnamed protein product [Bursaphelenchus xylophilus]|uniref:(pine wood nematode) hypothetical protein n=1 Tax=Bursaphelenchus xylophilus TaxID=6326 RepID=A0A7I8WK03_BURXY|nr:unnamed protein product [Bursaphelenchus xylophilus]CAG9107336.1 unnamed protein product [Bursaphelenchus xylophilus]
MAEFPNLGSHCAVSSCNLLDFLPYKCFKCEKEFCAEHFKAEEHECGIKDVRVPICPLCEQPVPVGKNESPDLIVGSHIDNDCKSDPARQKRAYKNRCSKKGCKKREVVPFTCPDCGANFCVGHRHGADHDCTGVKSLARQLQLQEDQRFSQRTRTPQAERCCVS